jgi:ABC-type Na+ transport system ATPase subunit NatA
MTAKLFDNLIRQGLVGKTVVYCSRKRTYIEYCTNFIILEEGKILARGSHSQLKQVFQELFEDVEDINFT